MFTKPTKVKQQPAWNPKRKIWLSRFDVLKTKNVKRFRRDTVLISAQDYPQAWDDVGKGWDDVDHKPWQMNAGDIKRFMLGLTTLGTVLDEETGYDYKGNFVCCSGADKYFVLYKGVGKFPESTVNLFCEVANACNKEDISKLLRNV